MANLLGMIVTWVTFPGVILHEWSHKFFCNIAGIPVYEVKYFSLGNPAGYVRHGEITRYRDAFLTTIAPFIINTIFALIMFIIPALNFNGILNLLFLWLGISFAMHAFPSDGDAKSLWAYSARVWKDNLVALIGFPIVGVIFIANLLRILWFDLIYAGFLFGITLGVVGFVFSGISVADIGHQASDTTHSYTAPTGSAMLKITPVPATQAIPGKEAAAKAWLSIAQDAMKSKNTNAVLISVNGNSYVAGDETQINGKSHSWRYTFASKASGQVYDVYVQDGTLGKVNQKALSDTSVEGILYKYGDPTIQSWNLDSTDVATISNDKFKEMTGKDAPASAAYRLEINTAGKLTWTIYNYDSTTRVIANIDVDPSTGAVGHTFMPSST